MSCSRCGGCLARERSLDFYSPAEHWRCINCGAQVSLCSSAADEAPHDHARRASQFIQVFFTRQPRYQQARDVSNPSKKSVSHSDVTKQEAYDYKCI